MDKNTSQNMGIKVTAPIAVPASYRLCQGVNYSVPFATDGRTVLVSVIIGLGRSVLDTRLTENL